MWELFKSWCWMLIYYMMNSLTEIQKFYANKTVFITGGTGFTGKCLVEKLLRSCPVKAIIIVVRSKRNTNFERRTEEYFNDVLFDKVKAANSKAFAKLIFVSGDIMLSNLGLSTEDYDMIIERTNIIFHCAATVNFLAPLHEAIPLNIMATKSVIDMAKKVKNLEALVHVSTAFSSCISEKIYENVTNLSYKPEFFIELVENMSKEDIQKILPTLLGKWPNTYVLTKHLAERLINEQRGDLPVSIYRPVAITQTYREPIPGWSNTFAGSVGVGISICSGAIKIINYPQDAPLHIIPVDLVVNCLIAVAWHTATLRNKEIKVYNHTSDKVQSRKQILDVFVKRNKYPLDCGFRYPGYLTVNVPPWIFVILSFFVHTAPNFLLDTVFRLAGKKARCQAMCNKARKLFTIIMPFLAHDFDFELKNVAALWNKLSSNDRTLFNFDADSVNYYENIELTVRGNKEILLKEDMANIKGAILQNKILYFLEYFYVILYLLIFYFMLKKLISYY